MAQKPLISRRPKYSLPVLGLVVVALALVGLYIVFRSHAATSGADINSDGKVDISDLSILAANYGKTGQTFAQGDLNSDGIINVFDLSILAGAWGTAGSSDTIAPTVALSAPANGTTVTTSPTTLSATANDNVAVTKVEFYDGSTLIGTDTSATGSSYSVTWAITSAMNGSHSITAKAYDAATNSKVSAAITVTVNITTTGGGGVMSGLHISGSSILNGSGTHVQMHGVNFSGFEYSCLSGGMNDGPTPPNIGEVNGMKSWNINTVRIPLNEDCWLGQHGIATAVSGANYQNAVANFVNLLTSNNVSVVLNLHFTGDGITKAVEQEPMADRAHSNNFWSSVASRFKSNSSVMFEPYNEPHLNDVTITGGTAWGCWRNGGCSTKGNNKGDGTFVVAGMQEMLTAIRTTGATNIIIATGEDWGTDLSGWAANKPTDSANQLVAGWHSYGDGLSCQTQSCWDSQLGAVLTTNPILATEIGQLPPQKTCAHDYIDPVMAWLDSHNLQGYYAWTWGPFSCAGDPALLLPSDSNWTGLPTQTYGSGYKAHLLTRP